MVFNANGEILESYDLSVGKLVDKITSITCTWVIDTEQVSHYEVIREYPNGGKDIELVIDTEEQGHWVIETENGYETDYAVGDNVKCATFTDVWEYQEYIQYTEDELNEIAEANSQREIDELKIEQRRLFDENLPAAIADIDEAICALYELMLGE